MTTLKQAREKGKLEEFIAEREAEGQASGDADQLSRLTARLMLQPPAEPALPAS